MYVIVHINNLIENLTTTLQSRSIGAYKANRYIESVIKGICLSYMFVEILLMKYTLYNCIQLKWNEEASYLLSYSHQVISLPRLNKRQL